MRISTTIPKRFVAGSAWVMENRETKFPMRESEVMAAIIMGPHFSFKMIPKRPTRFRNENKRKVNEPALTKDDIQNWPSDLSPTKIAIAIRLRSGLVLADIPLLQPVLLMQSTC